ncbi:MAG: MoaD/ThiS family protein [Chloroflexi bacterium]|nr:MoaD/ThiS family protein [Chloroflexota bacterium]
MMRLEIWLYGPLAHYAGEAKQKTHAQLFLDLPNAATMRDLVERLRIPLEQKGITFINGDLTDMPGLNADLERELHDGDRIGFFHEKSMWPFQYRNGASASPELMKAMQDRGLLYTTLGDRTTSEKSEQGGSDS